MSIFTKNHLECARECWRRVLNPDDGVIDATCGNGKDTEVLARMVPQGHVYAMDIQEGRREWTAGNVTFLLQSHVELPRVPKLKLIVYNLGYLPGGDKRVTTRTETTLLSLAQAVERAPAVSVMCYPGHEEGAKELEAVRKWSQNLKAQVFEFGNRAPVLFFVNFL